MSMKILIVRFSSFGDVLQCLSVAGALHQRFPESEIHWVTRGEFAPLLQGHPGIQRIWSLDRSAGLGGLFALIRKLRAQDFTHVYDAHNNLRSHLIVWGLGRRARRLRRSIFRWRRFLLFRFRINLFPQPFNGQRDLLAPLTKWQVPLTPPPTPQLFLAQELLARVRSQIAAVGVQQFVALAPSAAFPLKRWPLSHWRELISQFKSTNFVLLGGAQDQFVNELVQVNPQRVFSFVGKWNLVESAAAIQLADTLVANDTGLLHVAEQLGKPCVALMGPAPFGFPSRPSTRILEMTLPCRPCSKHGQGPCVNAEFQKCLRDITPAQVGAAVQALSGAQQ